MTTRMRKEYPATLKKRVGSWLRSAPRGKRKLVAEVLGVSDRTLRSWRRLGDETKKRGRKPKPKSLTEKKMILQEWYKQGKPGWRPTASALPGIRVRVIQETIAAAKKRQRRRAMEKTKKLRVSIEVKKVGTVAAMDGATVRKGEDLVIVRDRGSLAVQVKACHGPLRSTDTLEVLQKMKAEDRLPIMLCTDNGSPFCSRVVKDFLEKHHVIHLRSLPYVPQHNGSCENAVMDVKRQLNDGKSIDQTCEILNKCLRRRRLGWKTAHESEVLNFSPNNAEKRIEIYEAAKLAIKEALLGMNSGYEKRKAEREAILSTMERFELITRTRGDQTCAGNGR